VGLSNDEIAEQLQLSPLTVKTHVNRAMAKLGARDRAQLVVMAYQCGLVLPGTCASVPAQAEPADAGITSRGPVQQAQ
jgi:hypothetical protein